METGGLIEEGDDKLYCCQFGSSHEFARLELLSYRVNVLIVDLYAGSLALM